ncbi:MAG: hypothetical protein HZC28_14125 [Spirochaetes bacterium]|nr:hypothetical protein [Spirochaetota bacterium]
MKRTIDNALLRRGYTFATFPRPMQNPVSDMKKDDGPDFASCGGYHE